MKDPPISSTNFSTSVGTDPVKDGKLIRLFSIEEYKRMSIENIKFSQINEKGSSEEKSSDERISGIIIEE